MDNGECRTIIHCPLFTVVLHPRHLNCLKDGLVTAGRIVREVRQFQHSLAQSREAKPQWVLLGKLFAELIPDLI